MLYLFHGDDVGKVRAKAFEWVATARKKEPNLAYVRLAREELTDASLEDATLSGGLFVKRLLILIDDPYADMRDIVSPSSDDGLTMSEHGLSVFDEEVASQHGQLAIIDDEGVSFTSHLDGSLHRFTPERSVEIQHALGADMFFAFDECTSPTEPYEYQREAMERTHRWAERSLKAHRQMEYSRLRQGSGEAKQAIFGIVQGGRHEDLRRESAREIASLGFDGIGIGGSFSKEDMKGALGAAVGELPEELPRHFLGIGEPGDILEGIANGMDLFDCVAPTRIGRHGSIYTKHGVIHLRSEKYRSDFTPLSECMGFVNPTSDVGFTKPKLRASSANLEISGPPG